MSETTVKRPPTLAGACVYLGALAAIIAIRAFTYVTTWNAENRVDEFDRVLDALRDGGLSQAGAETSYKIFLTVIAVLGACAVVFAIYTARGDRASRIGLSVTIGIIGLSSFLGLLGGGVFFAMVGALAVVFAGRLWTGEIRTYFRTLAGHAPPPPKPQPVPVAAPVQPAAPFGDQQGVQHPVQQPVHPDAPAFGYTPPAPGYPGQRPHTNTLPRPVSIAVWTAFIGSVLVASVSGLGLLSLGLIGNEYEQVMRDSPLSDSFLESSGMTYDQLYRTSITVFGICLALAIGGLLASTLVLVKKRSGDVFLFVMAVVTIIASILFIPVGLPWTAAAIVCLVQLRKPESRAWFSAK